MDWSWAFDGVNQTIPRNAGPECSQYLSWQRQIIESVLVTTTCLLILHWTWKRLFPCPDPNEEHLLILQRRRYYDANSSQRRGTSGGAGDGGGHAANLERSSGYFGNTAPPPLLLLGQNSESDKNNGLLFNDVAPAAVCNNCGVHVNVNNSYCVHSGHAAISAQLPADALPVDGQSVPPPGQRMHCAGNSCSDMVTQAKQEGGTAGNNVIVMCDNMFVGKQVLLVLMTFVLGLEIGFKFSSRTVIYLLNPCHITTIMQIYLLASKPSKFATAIFRIQMNYLNGPMLAFLFPETESRKIPMEAILYWVQHGLMFINSIYLLRLKHAETGVRQYSVEPLVDWTWNIFSYACLMVYHFAVLVGLAIPTEVNLNHMLCPALLDPFNGPNYRLIAITHQMILCPLMCKTFCWAFAPAEDVAQRRRKNCLLSSNDSESSLGVSSVCSEAMNIASSASSVASSPSMEHPIQSLNRTEYLNLINDSEDEEASQRLISYEGDGHQQVSESTPVKRSGAAAAAATGVPPTAVAADGMVFSANVMMERNFAEFLDKKQE